jgi:hypothetical protein
MDGVSEELRPAVANRAANASNNTPDTDQLAANYDEKLKQMEKAQGKRFWRWARIVRKSLIE